MLQIQEAQKIPSIINTKKYAPWYIVSKLEKTKENKKILKEATGGQHLTCRKMRIKKRHIITIRNERRITTNPMDIKRIIIKYYEQLNAHEFDILDKMDQLCKRHKLPNSTQ